MKKIKSLRFNIIVICILGINFIGCGSSDETEVSINKCVGTFIDSPVKGLQYDTKTISGITDNQGKFTYLDGEIITFKIGNLELGSVKGENIISPLTLVGDTDLNNISIKATNIARILQTFDENTSNKGLIQISSALKELNVSNMDLESDADLETILTKAQNITAKSYILKDSESALNDMKKYIKLYSQYDSLSAGYYTNNKTTYYLLAMPNTDNIIFSATMLDFGSGVMHLFDIDLNEINYYNDSNIIKKDTVVKLKEGLYIIKVDYSSKGGTMTINSPAFVNQNSFQDITNGTYSGSKFTYYNLEMPEDGNIIFSATMLDFGSGVMHLFDLNLNKIDYFDNDNAIEKNKTVNLKAGKYVIKVDYPLNGGEFTIKSPKLD